MAVIRACPSLRPRDTIDNIFKVCKIKIIVQF